MCNPKPTSCSHGLSLQAFLRRVCTHLHIRGRVLAVMGSWLKVCLSYFPLAVYWRQCFKNNVSSHLILTLSHIGCSLILIKTSLVFKLKSVSFVLWTQQINSLQPPHSHARTETHKHAHISAFSNRSHPRKSCDRNMDYRTKTVSVHLEFRRRHLVQQLIFAMTKLWELWCFLCHISKKPFLFFPEWRGIGDQEKCWFVPTKYLIPSFQLST